MSIKPAHTNKHSDAQVRTSLNYELEKSKGALNLHISETTVMAKLESMKTLQVCN